MVVKLIELRIAEPCSASCVYVVSLVLPFLSHCQVAGVRGWSISLPRCWAAFVNLLENECQELDHKLILHNLSQGSFTVPEEIVPLVTRQTHSKRAHNDLGITEKYDNFSLMFFFFFFLAKN